ncbi:hypothetical protein [Putridiphycobacter roseus]|uniref:hypothetical protein n=1 Tax=Putridiphycobacter roseus TaxID=2219161 RepID=UPI00363F744D
MEINKQGIPQGAIYDKNGNYIEYKLSDNTCNAGLFHFIPALDTTISYNKPDNLNLKGELNKFNDLNDNKLNAVVPADFYLLIYYTVWSGKLNKDHVKIWEDAAKKNTNCNIKVIKVNMDFQENWEEGYKEKIKQATSKKK